MLHEDAEKRDNKILEDIQKQSQAAEPTSDDQDKPSTSSATNRRVARKQDDNRLQVSAMTLEQKVNLVNKTTQQQQPVQHRPPLNVGPITQNNQAAYLQQPVYGQQASLRK